MNKRSVSAAVALGIVGLLASPAASAGNGNPINKGSADEITLAVFGDYPYSSALLEAPFPVAPGKRPNLQQIAPVSLSPVGARIAFGFNEGGRAFAL